MKKFSVDKMPMPGLILLNTLNHSDLRGFYIDTWDQREFEKIGLNLTFVQDSHSRSTKGVLRGLHFQDVEYQGKLVRVSNGEIFDVAVDIRNGSPSFGKSFCTTLSDTNNKMIYIPPGFAHGFYTTSGVADVSYKFTNFYYPEYQSGIIWNDPDINIPWPFDLNSDLIISQRDATFPKLRERSTNFQYNLLE